MTERGHSKNECRRARIYVEEKRKYPRFPLSSASYIKLFIHGSVD
jgi:hypothetical protein